MTNVHSDLKGHGNQAAYLRDKKSSISSEQEGLQTLDMVHGWSTMTCITDMRSDLKSQGYQVT